MLVAFNVCRTRECRLVENRRRYGRVAPLAALPSQPKKKKLKSRFTNPLALATSRKACNRKPTNKQHQQRHSPRISITQLKTILEHPRNVALRIASADTVAIDGYQRTPVSSQAKQPSQNQPFHHTQVTRRRIHRRKDQHTHKLSYMELPNRS